MKFKFAFHLLCLYMIFLQLDQTSIPVFSPQTFASTSKNTIRVVSYNIHFGASANGKPGLSIISKFLASIKPDILCLQEVDKNTIRSLFLDQPHTLSKALSMKMAYGKADDIVPGTTGNLILSKFPILSTENKMLPSQKYKRSALKAILKTPMGKINVINTHLSLSKNVRKKQIEIIKDWILENRFPTILAGDFNTNDINELESLLLVLNDSATLENKTHISTFENSKYNSRIDYIFIPKTFSLKLYTVPAFHFSDHYPVIVDLYQ